MSVSWVCIIRSAQLIMLYTYIIFNILHLSIYYYLDIQYDVFNIMGSDGCHNNQTHFQLSNT